MVIACPHALGLAIPLVVSLATERAARGGVLVKDRLALEPMRTVDTVLFDKTGTLTRGEPAVTGIEPAAEHSEEELLALAAAAEAPSEHPLARAIVRAAEARSATAPGTSSAPPAVGCAPASRALSSRWAARTCSKHELADRLVPSSGGSGGDDLSMSSRAAGDRRACLVDEIRTSRDRDRRPPRAGRRS